MSCWRDGDRQVNASRSAALAFRRQQLLLGRPNLLVGDILIQQLPGRRLRSAGRTHNLVAFPSGRGGQPARKPGRLADRAHVVHELQPGALPDVLGVGVAKPVVSADGPYERGIPLDEDIPRLLVTLSGTRYEVGDKRAIAHRNRVLSSSARDQALVLMHSKCQVPQVSPALGWAFVGHASKMPKVAVLQSF